jgi:hypothetical protein
MFIIFERYTAYNRHGKVHAEASNPITEAVETLEQAFLALHKDYRGGRASWPTHNTSVNYEVWDKGHTRRYLLEDMYTQVIGQERFDAQVADETFAINLDCWITFLAETGDPEMAINLAKMPAPRL